jgi:ribosomal protein S18 acetylase RimI-like enzyme
MESVPMSGKNDMRIRRANEADGAEILNICRRSFPQIRWRGLPARGRTWWAVALASEAADTYVVESDGRIVAFALLVKNEQLWQKENELRQGSLVIRVLSRVLCPRLLLAAVCGTIIKLVNGTREFLPEIAVAGSYRRTWLEMLAVRFQYRRRGIAQLLLQQCEARTKALGRDAIALFVPRTNEPAIRLYKKMGYEKFAQTYEYDSYIKTLAHIGMNAEVSSA